MNKKRIKWDIKKAKKLFKDNGCKLLEEIYISVITKMRYICSCNRPSEITLSEFRRGGRCNQCAIEKNAEKFKFSYKKVKKIFREGGCRLISKEYKNCMEKVEYECSCGRTAEITLNSFRKGTRCNECGIEKRADKQRFTYEDVEEIFRIGGCRLISKEYKNSKELLDYQCNCRRFAKISLNHFQKGVRCRKCAIERNSGKNHYKYNHNLTEEEREIGRKYPEYGEWRIEVYERDDYICIISGIRGGDLVAHHLESYDKNIELRLVLSNGVTMSKEKHDLFHNIYGKGNNTTAQFQEFQLHQKMVEYQKSLNIEV